MDITWGMFSGKTSRWARTGWLAVAGLTALYIGGIRPYQIAKQSGIASGSGTEAFSGDLFNSNRTATKQVVETQIAVNMQAAAPTPPPAGSSFAGDSNVDRKMVRTASLDLTVLHPSDIAEKIRQITQQAGGFLVTSDSNGGPDATSASLTIRVPVAQFDAVRAAIRQLAVRINGERMEAGDVTRQYVDQQARLRNLKAEETQYLLILKQAKTVNDTLEVSEKLNDVRNQIEEQQAEFDALSKQVETVALNISLTAEADTEVFGLHWRPLYQLQTAARDGLQGIGDYAASMASFLFYVPTILLWLATILIGAALGWRVLRWTARRLFPRGRQETVRAS